jgi:hypothetical protein
MKNNLDELFANAGAKSTDEVVKTWAEFLTLPDLPFPNYRLYRGDLIDTAKLDFSVASLGHVNAYLDFLQRNPPPSKEITKVMFRCGGYLGEVIRKASPPNSCRWLSYDQAVRLNPTRAQNPMDPHTFVSMYNNSVDVFSYPIGKVFRRIARGDPDSIEEFAKLAITVHNQTKEKSDAFFKAVQARADVTGEKVVTVFVSTKNLDGN